VYQGSARNINDQSPLTSRTLRIVTGLEITIIHLRVADHKSGDSGVDCEVGIIPI